MKNKARTEISFTQALNSDYSTTQTFRVGDKVSKGFNGDCYPEGVIVKITPSGIIATDTGEIFRPYKHNGAMMGWKSQRTWWLVSGHHHKQNPSF